MESTSHVQVVKTHGQKVHQPTPSSTIHSQCILEHQNYLGFSSYDKMHDPQSCISYKFTSSKHDQSYPSYSHLCEYRNDNYQGSYKSFESYPLYSSSHE